jgi:hypothetical protein
MNPLADTPAGDELLDTRASSGLKKFLATPDRESIAELKNPELLKKFDEEHVGTVVYGNGISLQVIERGGRCHAKGIVWASA